MVEASFSFPHQMCLAARKDPSAMLGCNGISSSVTTMDCLQGMHFNNLTELHQASIALSGAIVAQRPYLPKRFYWKETTPQHYSTEDGKEARVRKSMDKVDKLTVGS